MKDVEIITALECCSKGGYECIYCPLRHRKDIDCTDYLTGSALELINHQTAMINRLWEGE